MKLDNTTKVNVFFLLVVFLFCLISVYDNTLNVIYSSSLQANEQNPVGSWLIELGGVYCFVATKSVTTIIVAFVSMKLVYTKYRSSLLWVLLFQSCLFYYLTIYSGNGVCHDLFSCHPGANPACDVLKFYGEYFNL